MLPSQAQHDRVRDELRRRPAPHADRQDPAGPRPPALLWAQRRASKIGHDQWLITTPVSGINPAGGVHAQLTAELRRRWIPAPSGAPWHITSIVAAYEPRPDFANGHLVLALTATIQQLGAGALDNQAMARDINQALNASTTDPRAA